MHVCALISVNAVTTVFQTEPDVQCFHRMVCKDMSFTAFPWSVGHAFNKINEVWQQISRRKVVRNRLNLAD